jgi:predicted dehydrogenase
MMIREPLKVSTGARVGVVGVGWIGGLRAAALARSPLVSDLSLADINEQRLSEVAKSTHAGRTTTDWEELLDDSSLRAVVIATTPETLHYPMARAFLEAGKHVLLEKPMALTLEEADHLVDLAETHMLKLAIGFTQRFNGKQGYIKQAIDDGRLGRPTSFLISRHSTRTLAEKIGNRIAVSPTSIEGTHDIDFALWCVEGRRPVEVYSRFAWGFRKEIHGVADAQVAVVSMDDGTVITVSSGYATPPNAPNQVSAWIEVLGTEGVIFADETRRDLMISTVGQGLQIPLSTMPGEQLDHVFAGPMERETLDFVEAVLLDRPVLVDGRAGALSLEVCMAADQSAETGLPVRLPLERNRPGTPKLAESVVEPSQMTLLP